MLDEKEEGHEFLVILQIENVMAGHKNHDRICVVVGGRDWLSINYHSLVPSVGWRWRDAGSSIIIGILNTTT